MTNKVKQEVLNHFKTAKVLSYLMLALCVLVAFLSLDDGEVVLGAVMFGASPLATLIAINRFK